MITPQLANIFANRRALLATMHGKEKAIAPLLESGLGLQVIVPTNFNTDRFGTFTRDIKRLDTQIATARAKITSLLQETQESCGIASEGSFYPHPSLPFVPCDREIVLLWEQTHNLQVIGEAISTETNFSHRRINSLEEAWSFAQSVGFPEHGLVVMPSSDTQVPEHIFKGITDRSSLETSMGEVLKISPTVHIETDMRAMYNPTRMKVIAQATENLLAKLRQFCPQCGFPGFSVVERKAGLPCQWCHAPTDLIQAEIYQCQRCAYRQENLFPQGITFAEPTYCSYCNP
jgi:hypothetical protein